MSCFIDTHGVALGRQQSVGVRAAPHRPKKNFPTARKRGGKEPTGRLPLVAHVKKNCGPEKTKVACLNQLTILLEFTKDAAILRRARAIAAAQGGT